VDAQGDVRGEAIDYVDAVVARAEGGAPAEPASSPARPRAGRLVPGFVKRSVVRALITLNRHPFDHLSHPMQVELEHQIAELRTAVHAANRRADQAFAALQASRPELETWRRALQAALGELERDVRSLRAKLDELDRDR